MNVDTCIVLSAYVYSCVVYVCVDMHIGMHVCTLLYLYATHDGVLDEERTVADRKTCSFFVFAGVPSSAAASAFAPAAAAILTGLGCDAGGPPAVEVELRAAIEIAVVAAAVQPAR